MFKPGLAFFLPVFCPPPPPPLFVLVQMASNAVSWYVTEAVSYFVISRISFIYLLDPPFATALAAKFIASVRILVMTVTVSVISAMVAPFLR